MCLASDPSCSWLKLCIRAKMSTKKMSKIIEANNLVDSNKLERLEHAGVQLLDLMRTANLRVLVAEVPGCKLVISK